MPPKDTLPTKSDIFKYWKDHFPEGLFIDWGEPSCWVCGFSYRTNYDVNTLDANWEEILRCWENIPLQRCHIVPKSLNGTDFIDNLFLMCRECHDLAPNTNIPEIFFEWAKKQNHFNRETAKIKQALEDFSIAESDSQKIYEILNSKNFQTWSEDKTGIHWPQSNYASTSSRLTPSTLIGLAAYFLRNTKTTE